MELDRVNEQVARPIELWPSLAVYGLPVTDAESIVPATRALSEPPGEWSR